MNKPENVVVTLPYALMETVRLMASEKGTGQFLLEAIHYFVGTRLRQASSDGYQAVEQVNLTLPPEVVGMVHLLAPEKGESQFLAEVITAFVAFRLREVLIAGYQATAEESLAIAKEWEPISNESWLLHIPPYEGDEPSDDAPDQQDDVILKT